MSESTRSRLDKSMFIWILTVMIVIVAVYMYTQPKKENGSVSPMIKTCREAQLILLPIFANNTSFAGYEKSDTGQKMKHYLDYIYQRLNFIVSKNTNVKSHVEEIKFYLKDNKLSSDDLSSVKQLAYKAKSENDYQGKVLDGKFFAKNKEIYIFLAYKKVNTLLSVLLK